MNGELEGHLLKLTNPSLRDEVVADYQDKGLGRERYGAVCGIKDEEGNLCMKRICLQGWAFAVDNSPAYCLHRENYDGSVSAVDDITTVLATHGLEWRPLTTRVKMREATDKSKKKKRKKRHDKVQVVEHRTDARDGGGTFGSAVRELEAEQRPPNLFRAYVSDERINELRDSRKLLAAPAVPDRTDGADFQEGEA